MSSIAAGTTTTTGYVVTSDSTGALVLKTGASATTAVTIDTSQNVGIGTSNPIGVSGYQGITIGGSTGGLIRLQSGASTQNAQIAANTSGFDIECVNTGIPMKFYTGGSERLRLDTSGNLGIGTSSPASKLDVKGSAGSGINLTHSNNTVIGQLVEFSGVQGAGLVLKNSSGTTNVLFNAGGDSYVIGGNVGIGISSPSTSLHVAGNATIGNAVAATNVSMFFNGVANKAKRIVFKSGSSEEWLIGQGAASETSAFEIYNGNGQMALSIAKANSQAIFNSSVSGKNLETVSSGTASYVYNTASGGSSVFGQDSLGTLVADLGTKPIYFYTNSAERARITNAGKLCINRTDSINGAWLAIQAENNQTAIGTIWADNTYMIQQRFDANYFMGVGADAAGRNLTLVANSADNTAKITFWTSGSGTPIERGRFTSAGDFDLYVTPAKDGQLRWTSGAGGAVQALIYANGNPELIAQTGGSGGVKLTSGATSWVSASDIRNKNIIEPISNGLEKVATLSSVIYSFKDDEQQTRRVGLVAQELLEVLPEAVYVPEKEEELLGVRYTEVIPLLVAAIKEQQAIIQQLQADVAALKGTA